MSWEKLFGEQVDYLNKGDKKGKLQFVTSFL